MTENIRPNEGIRLLSREVIDQIAAGEVVERPSHLVKELLENAIDAGATEITLDVFDQCTSFRVVDNGSGIARNDLAIALDRHTTSKIMQSEDLWNLHSYGFRGEALSSIAAVSELTLSSRTKTAESGARLVCKYGTKEAIVDIGHPLGTSIQIEKLFENLPARRKFMKSASAETSAVRQVVKAMSLSHPEISFKLTVESKLDLFYPKAPNLLERSRVVLGMKDLFFYEKDKGGSFKAAVVFGNPREAQKSSRNLWFLCQGRWIQDKTLIAASLEAFRGQLMHGEYPNLILSIELNPEEVDVNIHPTKSQVKFLDSGGIFRQVVHTIREALDEAPWNSASRIQTAVESYSENSEAARTSEATQSFLSGDRSNQSSADWNQVSFRKKDNLSQSSNQTVSQSSAESSSLASSLAFSREEQEIEIQTEKISNSTSVGIWSRYEVIGQAHLTYLICQSAQGVVLIDQHAAHERILFERLMQQWKFGGKEIQNFLMPLTVDLPPEKVEALQRAESQLFKMGVQVERLGPATLGVTSAPAFLKDASIPGALESLANQILDFGEGFVFDQILSDFCARLACHSAVRAGQALSREEMTALLRSMDEAPRSSFCPHGRPVSIDYQLNEIERDFGRTV